MVAVLTLVLPFQIDKYELFLRNRILKLKSEFQAKIGGMIAQLYGRVATKDLGDDGWDTGKLHDYVKRQLKELNIIKVADNEVIEYIKENIKLSESFNLDEQINLLIDQCAKKQKEKEFLPGKRIIMKQIKEKLFSLIRNSEQLNTFKNEKDDMELLKMLSSFLESID